MKITITVRNNLQAGKALQVDKSESNTLVTLDPSIESRLAAAEAAAAAAQATADAAQATADDAVADAAEAYDLANDALVAAGNANDRLDAFGTDTIETCAGSVDVVTPA